jgi:regulator of sigma E protease
VALPPDRVRGLYGEDAWNTPAARELVAVPGTRIEAVDGRPVSNFAELREALCDATRGAAEAGEPAAVAMTLRVPGEESARELRWSLDAGSLDRLHRLEWSGDAGLALFPYELVTLRADDPVEAIGMGLVETKRMVVTTYITFARLFQGTVKIEHLKGPVGIAQLGSRVAERGLIWLLFFMGLISINLAVINFLPLPIVDGGHFVFLLYEQVRGRPVPATIRNAVTLAGLVLIVLLFLLITYRDVMNLFST